MSANILFWRTVEGPEKTFVLKILDFKAFIIQDEFCYIYCISFYLEKKIG